MQYRGSSSDPPQWHLLSTPNPYMDGGVFVVDALIALPSQRHQLSWLNPSNAMDGGVFVINAPVASPPQHPLPSAPYSSNVVHNGQWQRLNFLYSRRHHGRPFPSRRNTPRQSPVERQKRVMRVDGKDLAPNCGHCVICLEELSCQRAVTKMPCSHLFHEDCLFRWLENHNTCPMCRSQV